MTLRQLFHLDILPGVPATWPDDTYDYFWIVDFPENSNVPSKFTMVKQEFGKSFPEVPANDWGKPDGLPAESGCIEGQGLRADRTRRSAGSRAASAFLVVTDVDAALSVSARRCPPSSTARA